MSRRWRFECAASRMVLTRTELNGRVCAHATHVIGTRGSSGDPITSIGASFRFSSPGLLEYLHVRPNGAAVSRCKNDPSPPARLSARNRPAWGSKATIAGGQVAGNSIFKFSQPPRAPSAFALQSLACFVSAKLGAISGQSRLYYWK